jgi:hypothetical protein
MGRNPSFPIGSATTRNALGNTAIGNGYNAQSGQHLIRSSPYIPVQHPLSNIQQKAKLNTKIHFDEHNNLVHFVTISNDTNGEFSPVIHTLSSDVMLDKKQSADLKKEMADFESTSVENARDVWKLYIKCGWKELKY